MVRSGDLSGERDEAEDDGFGLHKQCAGGVIGAFRKVVSFGVGSRGWVEGRGGGGQIGVDV